MWHTQMKNTKRIQMSKDKVNAYKAYYDKYQTMFGPGELTQVPYLKMLTSKTERIPEGWKYNTDYKEGDFLHSSEDKVLSSPKVVIFDQYQVRFPRDTQNFVKSDLQDLHYMENNMQYTLMVSGYLVDEKKPFTVFLKGLALSPYFELMNEVREISKTEQVPLPAFILEMGLEYRDGKKYKNVPTISFKNTGKYADVSIFELLDEVLEDTKADVRSYVSEKNGISNAEYKKMLDTLAKTVKVDVSKEAPASDEIDLDDIPF